MLTIFPNEFKLAIACAMWPPSEKREQAIRTLAASGLDWPFLVRIASRHRVFGLVFDGLSRAGIIIPAEIATTMRRHAVAIMEQNLAYGAETLRLQRLFDERNISVTFFKGVALALLAYGEIGMKHGRDIDFLVRQEDFGEACDTLATAGYARVQPPPGINKSQLDHFFHHGKEFEFVHTGKGFRAEVHWRLLSNPHLLSGVDINSPTVDVIIAPNQGIRSLGGDDLFAYLCAHGAMHAWFRLKWIADLNALLSSRSDEEVVRLYYAAQCRGAARSVGQALLLREALFGRPVPALLAAEVSGDLKTQWLARFALTALTRGGADAEPATISLANTRNAASLLLLSDKWRFLLAELVGLLSSNADRATLPLPRWLHWLYPLLRIPLGLWRLATRWRQEPPQRS